MKYIFKMHLTSYTEMKLINEIHILGEQWWLLGEIPMYY